MDPAVLGAALGTAGGLVSGWSRWPLVGAVTVWSAAFLLPLYWPGLRSGRYSPRTELLLVLHPARGLARVNGEEERRFRYAAFPLYGLTASFTGQRYLAASGTSRRHGYDVCWLSLGHGDPRPHPGGAWLIVETAPTRSALTPSVQRRRLAERLWGCARMEAYRTHGRLPQDFVLIGHRPDPASSSTPIDIDDAPVVFEYLADGESWAARATCGDEVVSVLASRMPAESVALATLADLEAHIDGSRRIHASAACLILPPHPAG